MWTHFGMLVSGTLETPSGTVSVGAHSAFDLRQEPTNAVCDFIFGADGSLRKFEGSNGYTEFPGEWKLHGDAADYQIRFEAVSGDAPNRGNDLDDWMNMAIDRSIGMLNANNFDSSRSGQVRVKIRDVATLTEQVSVVMTLTATVIDVT